MKKYQSRIEQGLKKKNKKKNGSNEGWHKPFIGNIQIPIAVYAKNSVSRENRGVQKELLLLNNSSGKKMFEVNRSS